MVLWNKRTYVLLGYIIGGLHAEDNGREKKAIDNITNRGGVQPGLWLFASVIKLLYSTLLL